MKKVLLSLAILVVIAGFAFAGGQDDGTMTLTAVWGGQPGAFPEGEDPEGFDGTQSKLAAGFEAENPGVKIRIVYRDVTQGSLTVDAMMAKGDIPDVWQDAQGYFIKYLNEDYALPLEKYLDTSVYYDHMVDPWVRNGHVYALPSNNVAGGLVVNLDMLGQIGYAMPAQPDWTTVEFTKLSKKLQSVGIPSTMISGLDGMNSWIWPWVYAFGGELFKNNDYTQVAVNTPEAKKGFEYMKMLCDEGYAYPYPNEQSQDTSVELFTTGKVFSSMMQNGHVGYWLPQQVAQGKLDKEFNLTFVEAPHAPGREHTKTFGYYTIAVAHKSDSEERNEMVAKLLRMTTGEKFQYYNAVVGGGFPTIKGLSFDEGNAAKPMYKAIDEVRVGAGVMDLGGMSAGARELNQVMKMPVQEFFAGRIDAQGLLDTYSAEAARILK